MQKILTLVFVCIFYFSAINSVANEKQLTILENELLNYVIGSLQSSAIHGIEYNNDLELFHSVGILNAISSLAYAMVLAPDGKVLAHNKPVESGKILNDDVTKKVLEYRDHSEILIQKLKMDNRDVLDFSLPVFSSSEPKEYLGAVRFALYLN